MEYDIEIDPSVSFIAMDSVEEKETKGTNPL
jgi:hypothetical protein